MAVCAEASLQTGGREKRFKGSNRQWRPKSEESSVDLCSTYGSTTSMQQVDSDLAKAIHDRLGRMEDAIHVFTKEFGEFALMNQKEVAHMKTSLGELQKKIDKIINKALAR